jgi:carbohydrate kinase (thermoresistant glucokinase family)
VSDAAGFDRNLHRACRREALDSVAVAGQSKKIRPLLVVMGVSGSGKSTVGAALARRLGVPFIDGDDLHSESNVQKMASGHPLTDEDRWPWLARVGQALAHAEGTGLVVACSALKKSYRDAIRAGEPEAFFLHLTAPRQVLQARVAARHGHFMPASLLDSQLETLEPLSEEAGAVIDVSGDVDTIVAAASDAVCAGRSRVG